MHFFKLHNYLITDLSINQVIAPGPVGKPSSSAENGANSLPLWESCSSWSGASCCCRSGPQTIGLACPNSAESWRSEHARRLVGSPGHAQVRVTKPWEKIQSNLMWFKHGTTWFERLVHRTPNCKTFTTSSLSKRTLDCCANHMMLWIILPEKKIENTF